MGIVGGVEKNTFVSIELVLSCRGSTNFIIPSAINTNSARACRDVTIDPLAHCSEVAVKTALEKGHCESCHIVAVGGGIIAMVFCPPTPRHVKTVASSLA